MSGLNKSQIAVVAENINYDFIRAINLVGRRIEDNIREAAVEATAEKLSTGQTVRQMQKKLIEKLEEQDVTYVTYRNGRRMPLKSYAEMVSRTTTAEAQNTAKIVQGKAWGYDLVEIASHSPTCEVCAMYQGRVYAITKEAANGKYRVKDGTVLRFPYLFDTAFASGYNTIHPNCRHRISPYHIKAYTGQEAKEAARISNAPFEDTRSDEERKKYSAMQAKNRQRLANRRQYERIKSALPDTAPKSYSGFIRMKQTNSEKYQELMRDCRYISRVAKQQESGIIKIGGNSGALNPYSKEAEEHAVRYYESVRHMTTDTAKISQNTNISKDKIDKIKNHIFIKEHNLLSGTHRFDPSYDMAQPWQRLINGKNIQEKDIVLLKHEYSELRYMERGLTQSQAHIKASKKYNYTKYCE